LVVGSGKRLLACGDSGWESGVSTAAELRFAGVVDAAVAVFWVVLDRGRDRRAEAGAGFAVEKGDLPLVTW
jgi:hypothetical protein